MKICFKNVSFRLSFIISIIIWAAVFFSEPEPQHGKLCFDCDSGFGRPFRVYESGSAASQSHIVWGGIILNILVIILTGIALGIIFNYIYKKFFAASVK